MHPTNNSLSENVRVLSAKLLNRHLSAAIDLHAQVKQAHWNVRGANFIALHELFDEVAGDVEDWSDLLAERVAALGADAEGTIQVAAARSFLSPYPLKVAGGPAHVDALASVLGVLGASARAAIDEATGFGDADTADILTEISRACDQQLWKVEAHREPA